LTASALLDAANGDSWRLRQLLQEGEWMKVAAKADPSSISESEFGIDSTTSIRRSGMHPAADASLDPGQRLHRDLVRLQSALQRKKMHDAILQFVTESGMAHELEHEPEFWDHADGDANNMDQSATSQFQARMLQLVYSRMRSTEQSGFFRRGVSVATKLAILDDVMSAPVLPSEQQVLDEEGEIGADDASSPLDALHGYGDLLGDVRNRRIAVFDSSQDIMPGLEPDYVIVTGSH